MESLRQQFRKLSSHSGVGLPIKAEISSLQVIRAALQVTPPIESGDDSVDLEQDFLTLAADTLESEFSNPFPSFKLDLVLSGQDELNDFMFYVLERRYGWSESNDGRGGHVDRGDRGGIDHEHVTRLKATLNDLLESFIHWFLCQSISVPILCSFRNAISRASNRPVVRNQTLVIMMEWLHQNSHEPCFHIHCRQVQELLICGVTDIWSAIRNACIGRLGPIAECFTLVKLEAFYCSLVKICQSPQSSWQAKEGAIMAVIIILRNFHWVGRLSHSFSENHFNERNLHLKYGREEMTHLPRFLGDTLHSLIYPLLAHPQISIRENATKAFTSFLSRCEFQEALNALDEAVTRLSPVKRLAADNPPFESLVVQLGSGQFIDAYEAEGLISVCVNLIKQIPASFLLKKWSFYFTVFNACLMHPASTVRQATSTLLKFLVAKSSQAPIVLKLTLQSLVTNWCTGVDRILAMDTAQPSIRMKMGKVVQDHRPGTEETSKRAPPDQTLLASWEWKEGRLLTYELIAKYLVHNHVHYFFPPQAIRHARFRGTHSVDTCMPSRFHQVPSREKIALSKSVDHSSLRQAWAANRPQSAEGMSGSTTPNDSPRHLISPTHDRLGFSSSESDKRRKNNLEQKRARTFGESNSNLRLTPNQYDHHDESKRSPTYPPVGASIHPYTTSSLLHLIRDMERRNKQNDIDVTESRYVPFPTRLTDESEDGESQTNIGRVDDMEEMGIWELVPMATLLSQVLLQTIECLGSDQWELRRMGHQTLPILTEAIRYYDITLLTALTERYLAPVASVMTYALTLTIKSTLQHAKRLELYADTSADSSIDSTKSILDTVESELNSWAATARDIADRPVIDKLSLAAVDILFLACTSFPQYLNKDTKAEVEAACLQFTMDVFSHAHCSHRYARYLYKTRRVREEFESPSQGYLSILKTDGLHRLCLQVQQSFISECHTLLLGYIGKSCVEDVICLLPILLHYVIVYMEDLDLLKTLLEGCRFLVSMVDENECCLYSDEFYTALEYSLLGIIDIINTKVTEISTLRPILEFYIILSQLVSSTYHLTALFKVIHSRLQVGNGMSTLDVCNNDLAYRSNDIPASPVDNQPIAENEDEFDENGQSHPLATSLNASNSSSQLTGVSSRGRSSSLVLPTDESESDSDWDSWDEEEDDQSVLEELFGDFLRRLQGHYRQMAAPGEMSAFEARLDMVGVLPNRTIFRLLHTEFLPLT